MRPVAQGRPGTTVIPTGWSAAHRPVVDGTQTATCTIRKPGGTRGPFDQTTGEYQITPNPAHYDGPCRLQMMPALEQNPVTGDEQVPTATYLVTIPWDASPELAVDDVVTFIDPGPEGDPTLAGVAMRVRSFSRGSLTWERDIYVTDNLS